MFGKGKRSSPARVVARQPHKDTVFVQGGDPSRTTWDYVVDVAPEDATAPFRANFSATFAGDEYRLAPNVGDEAWVTYREDGTHVHFDGERLLAKREAAKEAARQRFEAASAGVPGEPVDTLEPLPGDPPRVAEFKQKIAARRAAAAEPSAGEPSRVAQLQELAALHDRGALTDAEFAAEKSRILNG